MSSQEVICSENANSYKEGDISLSSNLGGIATTTNLSSGTENSPANSKHEKPCSRSPFHKIKLEILTFLFMFSYVLTKITSQAMIVDKVCLFHFKYSEDICNNLKNHTDIKSPIEKMSTNYQLGYNLIQTAPAAILSCYIGPWSDRYGRKLPVMIAIVGMILSALGSAICAHFLISPVEYYYVPASFAGLFGGTVSLLALVYSYASDMTSPESRTMKYAYIELASGLAMASGTAAGGWLYNFFGYPPVFYVSFGGFCLSLLWVTFMLPETQGLENKDDCSMRVKNLFSCDTFKESFAAIIKERSNRGKCQIILLIFTLCFIAISTSSGDINYLFVHHEFNWGNTKYSTVSSIYTAISIVLLLILVPLFRYLKVPDPILGLIGSASILVKFFGIGLSFSPAIFHVANILGILSAFAPMAARSRISKVVSKDDLGKIFQFVVSGETLLPVLSSVLTSLIFYAFLNVYAGAAYITLGILLIFPFSVFVWLQRLPDLKNEDIAQDMYTEI